MNKLQKRPLLVVFAILLVCFPYALHAAQVPSQTAGEAAGKKSDRKKKTDQEQNSAAGQKPPSKAGETKNQKLELTRVAPAAVTASDSLQELSLMVVGAADGEKLKISFKSPDAKPQPEQEATVNKGVVKVNTKLSRPGIWEITISNQAGSSKPYSLTVWGPQAVCHAQPTAAQVQVFWEIVKVMNRIVVALFALLVLGLIVAASSKKKWSLGDALSEESSCQPRKIEGRDQIVMVASSSRIIAVFGLSGILALMVGIGYSIVWNLIVCGTSPDLGPIKAFLVGMAAVFAPYLANQLREVFSPSNPTEKAEPAKPAPPSGIKISGVVPALLSASPNIQHLNLLGTEFQTWMSVTLIDPDGRTVQIPAANVAVGGPTQFTITTTLDRGGTWKAVVTSPSGISSPPFVFAVRAPAPAITGIVPQNPASNPAVQTLTINGTDLMPNAVITLIAPNGTESKTQSTWTNANQMRVQATLPNAGPWRIRVLNPGNDQPAELVFNVA